MRYVKAEQRIAIPLGRQGENNVETVRFHVDGWAELYGEGAYELLHQRANDPGPYPCPISVSTDGKIVEWLIRNSDVAKVGRGTAQFVYIVNGNVAKSVVYATSVLESIDGGGDVPEPYEDWVNSVLFAAQNAAEEAAEEAVADVSADLRKLIADDFSEEETYDVGEYAFHEIQLYRCKVPIETPGAWDASDWELVTITEALNLLTLAIAEKVDKVAGMGLSHNDFTDTLKNKLDGIAEGATADSAMTTEFIDSLFE